MNACTLENGLDVEKLASHAGEIPGCLHVFSALDNAHILKDCVEADALWPGLVWNLSQLGKGRKYNVQVRTALMAFVRFTGRESVDISHRKLNIIIEPGTLQNKAQGAVRGHGVRGMAKQTSAACVQE